MLVEALAGLYVEQSLGIGQAINVQVDADVVDLATGIVATGIVATGIIATGIIATGVMTARVITAGVVATGVAVAVAVARVVTVVLIDASVAGIFAGFDKDGVAFRLLEATLIILVAHGEFVAFVPFAFVAVAIPVAFIDGYRTADQGQECTGERSESKRAERAEAASWGVMGLDKHLKRFNTGVSLECHQAHTFFFSFFSFPR